MRRRASSEATERDAAGIVSHAGTIANTGPAVRPPVASAMTRSSSSVGAGCDSSSLASRMRKMSCASWVSNSASVELQVAIDGLTVVVNPGNEFASCLTVDELAKVYGPDSPATLLWSDVRALANEPVRAPRGLLDEVMARLSRPAGAVTLRDATRVCFLTAATRRFIMALWVAFGLISICGALTVAELSSMLPRTGGEYVFLREAYGDAAAFVFGWLYVLVSAPAAVGALSMVSIEFLLGALRIPPENLPPWGVQARTPLLNAMIARGDLDSIITAPV